MESDVIKSIGNKDEVLSVIKDPFNLNCIEGITLRAYKDFSGKVICYGLVQFKNENTSGEQRFEAQTLSEVYIKVHEFCEGLT